MTVRYRDFWGTDKREALLKTLEDTETFDAQYEQVKPVSANRFSFRPSKTEANYESLARSGGAGGRGADQRLAGDAARRSDGV